MTQDNHVAVSLRGELVMISSMMKRVLGNAMVGGAAALIAYSVAACDGFNPQGSGLPQDVNDMLSNAPLTEPTSKDIRPVPGLIDDHIFVRHGQVCAKGEQATSDNGKTVGIRIKQGENIPPPYDSATVLQNGWYLAYDSTENHQLAGLGSAIFNAEQHGNQLRWEAFGVISDKTGNDAFTSCVYPTLIYWDSNAFEMIAWQSDDNAELTFLNGFGNGLSELSGSFEDPLAQPKAVVPRGFGFGWRFTDDDHNLLQVAFDHGDPGPNLLGSDSIEWTSRTILKDNSADRTYGAFELVSVLSGPSVQELGVETTPDNPFPMQPRAPRSCQGFDTPTYYEKQYEVRVPSDFDFAFPKLNGWDMGHICDDDHLSEIGVWIEDIEFTKPPGEPGRLSFTVKSVYRNRDLQSGSHEPFYKLSIIGLNLRNGAGIPDDDWTALVVLLAS